MWSTSFGNLTRSYVRSVWSLRDRRLDGFFLMGEGDGDDETWPSRLCSVAAVSSLYVTLSAAVGPALMRSRSPFQLKTAVLAYNALQVCLNSFALFLFVPAFRRVEFNFLCQPVHPSTDDPDVLRLVLISYCFFMIKFLDLVDTAFFVLRKRNHQITFLHVYHHALMPVYLWPSVRFVPGGNNIVPSFLNGIVHIFMYSYYFMAALGPKYRWLLIWKRWMTTAQIVQFLLMLGHTALQFVVEDCGFPPEQTVGNVFLVAPFLALFLNYYVKEYVLRTNVGKRRNVAAAEETNLMANGDAIAKKDD